MTQDLAPRVRRIHPRLRCSARRSPRNTVQPGCAPRPRRARDRQLGRGPITMSVEAARDCLAGGDRDAISSIVMASTTHPFATAERRRGRQRAEPALGDPLAGRGRQPAGGHVGARRVAGQPPADGPVLLVARTSARPAPRAARRCSTATVRGGVVAAASRWRSCSARTARPSTSCISSG